MWKAVNIKILIDLLQDNNFVCGQDSQYQVLVTLPVVMPFMISEVVVSDVLVKL